MQAEFQRRKSRVGVTGTARPPICSIISTVL